MSLLDAVSQRHVPSLAEATGLLDEALAHRAELAAIELAEARNHVQTSALLLAVSAVLILLTGFAITFTVAALVWDSPHRGWWLAGLCVVYLGSAVATAVALRKRLQTWEPFVDTRTQLKQDHECLSGLVKSILP